jgi:hypothetical protein
MEVAPSIFAWMVQLYGLITIYFFEGDQEPAFDTDKKERLQALK